MDFRNYLKKSAKEIDGEVKKILDDELKRAKGVDKNLAPLIKEFAKFCEGGKRIRGTLAILGYQLSGGKSKEIVKIAAALEICHAAILAHDDIIDKSRMRRGKPSLHIALGSNHYGMSQAITLADYGFFLAVNTISQTQFPKVRKNEALTIFSKVMIETAYGQMLELEKGNPLKVVKLKTAYYTISGPLRAGAVLGGVSDSVIRFLGEFGENLGIAFQIRDDILDNETNGTIGAAGKEAVKYKQSLQQLRCFKDQALTVLPNITKDPRTRKLLQQMSEYLVNRTK